MSRGRRNEILGCVLCFFTLICGRGVLHEYVKIFFWKEEMQLMLKFWFDISTFLKYCYHQLENKNFVKIVSRNCVDLQVWISCFYHNILKNFQKSNVAVLVFFTGSLATKKVCKRFSTDLRMRMRRETFCHSKQHLNSYRRQKTI